MSIKLLVFDVDGMFVDKDKKVVLVIVDVVRWLKVVGFGFMIISVWLCLGMMLIVDLFGIDELMGVFNGGIVFKCDGIVIEYYMIDEDVVCGVMDIVGDVVVDMWFFVDDVWYVSIDQGVYVGSEWKVFVQDLVIVLDFFDLFVKVDKVMFVSDDEDLLCDLYEKVVVKFDCQVMIVQSQIYYFDIMFVVGNKGSGVEELVDVFGILLIEIVVIGDQVNDIVMFKCVKLVIVMGNVLQLVCDVVYEIIFVNDVDGVVYVIDKFIFIGVFV